MNSEKYNILIPVSFRQQRALYIIEVFKIMHGYEGLNKDMFFRIKNDSITRGHSLALVKSHSRLDIRKYTFSQRVVNDWNKLPEECINATSVNMFKNKIDQYYLKTRRE